MGLQNEKIAALSFVTADLNYLTPSVDRPRTYTFEPPSGQPKSNIVPDAHSLPIYDIRLISETVSLDREGFALVRQTSSVKDFYNDDEIKAVYYPEAERLIKAATGADRVFIFDHTVRKRVEGAEDRAGNLLRQPVARVHVDHTAKSGPQRVRDLIPDEAEELLKGRVQIINIWRPIRGPLLDSPLAVCDARTVHANELVASDLVYPNRVGETYSVKYNPEHQWFYVPRMTVDEALLLKCYDSATDGRSRFAPHTAFADPTTPADAPPRESIELRTLVFHK
ncbi:CmcJ/NvfI family oxidoreductase [Bradyrhizobium sp. dw_411]|uniref:CmcJ/NvfI family oxidoreductase n=1 Tax=Bradyrhizobium sp. dw_411 TaxID=2720082 RepID=UPI001BD0083C|nr:CmcJ/NvfI family oxidoreductase [Bradyrhizobium sp. dw_411]